MQREKHGNWKILFPERNYWGSRKAKVFEKHIGSRFQVLYAKNAALWVIKIFRKRESSWVQKVAWKLELQFREKWKFTFEQSFKVSNLEFSALEFQPKGKGLFRVQGELPFGNWPCICEGTQKNNGEHSYKKPVEVETFHMPCDKQSF